MYVVTVQRKLDLEDEDNFIDISALEAENAFQNHHLHFSSWVEHYPPLLKTEWFVLLEGQQCVLSRHLLLRFKFWDLFQGFMVRFGGCPAHTLCCTFPYLKRQLANVVIRTSPFFLHSFDFSSCNAPMSLELIGRPGKRL